MDFHARIWERAEVRTRYYHSEFMEHSTADDMITIFETATSDLDLKIWKFYDMVQAAKRQ